jgi:sn-glycerol 3-phosphate transport system substrate-binding protein
MSAQQMTLPLSHRTRAGLKGAAAITVLVLGAAVPAWAHTELQWWHAIAGGNNSVIVRLAEEFNSAQTDYKIVPIYKGTYSETMRAGLAAFRAGNAPHILQVFEVGTATMMAAKGAVKPVYELMQEAGEPFDPKAYLPAVASHYSTATGEMLSFPFNSSTMVTWINRDALKRARLNPDHPLKTWPELFEAARRLKNAGFSTCGFSTTWAVWAHLEQLSAWHNLPFATQANGLEGPDAELVFNGPIQIRHLQNLAALQKDKTFDYSGRGYGGETRFTSGECPLLLNSSGFYGNVKANARFDWAAAPMPYYPDVPGAPQNSIIGGASLWAMGGRSLDEYRGVARFFTFLSDTDRQARLHQESGYLPITRAAYEKTKASGFYQKNPSLEVALIELTSKEPTENSRGLRLGNMVQLREVVAEEIEAALAGEKSAKEALNSAVERGNQILRQFERQGVR